MASRLFPDASGEQHAFTESSICASYLLQKEAQGHPLSAWLDALAALLHAYTAHDPDGGPITLLQPQEGLFVLDETIARWTSSSAVSLPATAAFAAAPAPDESEQLVETGKARVAVYLKPGELLIRATTTALTPGPALRFLEQLAVLVTNGPGAAPSLGMTGENISLRNLGTSSQSHADLRQKSIKQAPAAKPTRLDTLFSACAQQYPHQTAIDLQPYLATPSSGGEQDGVYPQRWTYADLYARASRIAAALAARHLSPPPDAQANVVVLVLPKSGWTFAAQLGIVMTGSAWCPIDIDWPMERRSALLAKARPLAVLTYGARLAQLVQDDMVQSGMAPVPILRLDTENIDVSAPVDVPPHAGSGSDLAYLIWTSGTTGLPKAVAIEHRSVIAVIDSLLEVIPHDSEFTCKGRRLRYLQFSEYTFDLSILDTFYTFSLGGALVASDRGSHIADIGLCLRETEATHTLLTPAVLALLPRHEAPALRVVINGGEKCTPVVADRWSRDCTLLNLYGPAEATLIAFHRRIPVLDNALSGDIGIPLPSVGAGAMVALPNAKAPGDLGPVPQGAVAELVLSGPQLARAYLYDDAKTVDKFVFVPGIMLGASVSDKAQELGYPQKEGYERVYRTGDLVRFSDGDRTHFLGRNDDQVKIHGIRIEVAEITSALRAAADILDVADSLTMAFPSPAGDQVLCHFACIGLGDGEQAVGQVRTDTQAVQTAASLRQAAREHLPAYMVPALFVILHAGFPRTSSAKVDRVALERILTKLDVAAWESLLAPQDGSSPEEEPLHGDPELNDRLRTLVADLTGQATSAVGDRTPLASLGVDSVRAIALAKAISPLSDATVSPIDITRLGRRGISGLVDGLHLRLPVAGTEVTHERGLSPLEAVNKFSQALTGGAAQALGLSSDEVEAVVPPTSTQLGMLAETLRAPEAYIVEVTMDLLPDLGETLTKALREALQVSIDECFTLRTCFVSTDDVLSFAPELSNLCKSTIKAVPPILQVVRRSVSVDTLSGQVSPILGARPPVRISTSPNKLIIRMHHALYDARTLALLRNRINHNLSSRELLSQGAAVIDTAASTLALTEDWDEGALTAWDRALGVHKGRLDTPTFPDIRLKASVDVVSVFGLESYNLRITQAEVEAAADRLGVTPRAMYAATWGYLLSIYFGTAQFNMGETVSLRPHLGRQSEAETCLVATVPVPIDFDGTRGWDSLAALAVSVHKAQEAAMVHPLLTAGTIRRLLGVPASAALYSALFTYTPTSRDVDERACLGPAKPCNIRAEHGLALEVLTGEEVTVELSFDPHLIDPEGAPTILHQFDALMQAFLIQPLSELNGLQTHIQVPPQDVAIYTTPSSRPDSLASKLITSLTMRSSQVAVEVCCNGVSYQTTKYTYKELAELVGKVAGYLYQTTVSGAAVAVHLPRSIDTYAAMLGIMLSGRRYVPIDMYLPPERKAALLSQVDAALVFTNEPGERAVTMTEVYTAAKDTLAPGQGDNVACIMFTSGSTGVPKQVGLSYKNLDWAIAAFDATLTQAAPGGKGAVTDRSGARFLARSAEAFDVHLLEALLPLSRGATVVTAERDVLMADLPGAMRELEVTHSAVVPSLFYHPSGAPVAPEYLPSLRLLIVGGERMHNETITLWGEAGVPVLQAYGPTEATIGSSCAVVSSDSKASNVGRPFPGTTYVISDERRRSHLTAQGHEIWDDDVAENIRPLLKGVVGELVIVGPQVAQYLSDDANSAFSVFNCPQHPSLASSPTYRTGDLARMHSDGSVEILGRIGGSGQIKVNGVRIELDEVAMALSQIEVGGERLAVACFALELGAEGKKIGAAVASERIRTTSDPSPVSRPHVVRDLMQAARTRLPPWMIPARVFTVDFVPLQTVSGKVNLKALATLATKRINTSPDADVPLGATGNDGPVDLETARTLQELFSSLLQRDAIPMDQDLFFIGLDSLLAIRAAHILLKQTGQSVASHTILQYPTIRSLACHLVDLHGASSTDQQDSTTAAPLNLPSPDQVASTTGVSENSIELVGPTLPAQAAMLSDSVLQEGQVYLTTLKLPLPSTINAAAVKDAWRAIALAHPIYRTVFMPHGRSWVQVVLTDLPSEVVTESDAPWSQADEQEVVGHIRALPPLRVRITTSDVRILMHHALYDGVSLDLLLAELQALWKGEATPVPSRSHASTATALLSSLPVGADEFWAQHLSDVSLVPFPNLTGERPDGFYAGQQRDVNTKLTLPLSVLKERAAAQGATLQVLVTSAVLRLVSMHTASPAVCVGLVLHGRHWPLEGIEEVHGPLLNLVPCRWQGDATSDNRLDVPLKVLQQEYARIFALQAVGLPSILRSAQLDAAPFDVLVAYQEASSVPSNMGDAAMAHGFPLAFEITSDITSDAVHVTLRYSLDRLNAAAAHVVLRQLCAFMEQDPHQDALPSVEHELLSLDNPNPHQPTDDEHFLRLFQAHVEGQPEAPAVWWHDPVTESTRLYTYAEVDELSGRIAAALRLSAPAASVIGVHLDRGPDLYMTLVGVWKAGKGYLPIDVSLPDARVAHMLNTVQQAGMEVAIISFSPLSTFDQLLVLHPTSLLSAAPGHEQQFTADLSSTSYILFTSGSTGQPKGVHLTHRALSGALTSWVYNLPHKPTSRLLQLASPGFDVSIMEVCLPLALGFSLASGPKEWLLTDLTAALTTLGVTMADLPAALVGYVDPSLAERLEWLMSGGDAMDARVLDNWGASHKLINAWGPTETTIGNTLGFMGPRTARTVVGTSYRASTVLVVRRSSDGRIEPTWLGCEGEIAIAGPQLALGYVGRPDLTQQAFTCLEDGTPIYLTGDAGRLLPGGLTQILGRIDKSMVKINGQRVELDEVSSAFCAAGTDGAVMDAVSLYVRHPSGARKQLVTIVAPTDGVELEQDTLSVRTDAAARDLARRLLAKVRQTLAPYMVPARVIVVAQSRFPLTVNNKINRQAIEAFYLALNLGPGRAETQADQSTHASDQATPRQEIIRSVVAAIVGCATEQVALTEPFVRLGLDSIASIALAQRLSKELGTAIRPRLVVENDTVLSLDAALNQGQLRLATVPPTQSVESAEIANEMLPCLPMQVGMLSQALASDGQRYVHEFVVSLTSGAQPYSTLLRAIRAWDTLCLSFSLVPEELQLGKGQQRGMAWVQTVRQDPAAVLAAALDLGVHDPAKTRALIAKGGQPWAVQVHPGHLIIILHHALYDATSMDALLAFIAGGEHESASVHPTPFGPAVRDLLPTEADQEFWVKALTPVDLLAPLPVRSMPESTGSLVCSHSVAGVTLAQARKWAAEQGIELAVLATLATAWVRAGLANSSGKADVVLGRVSSLRTRVQAGGASVTGGCLLNTLPALVPTGKLARLSAGEALRWLKEQVDTEAQHDRVSLRQVAQDVVAARRQGQTKAKDTQLFDVLLDYQVTVSPTSGPAESDEQEDGEYPDQVQYGLNFEVRSTGDGLSVRVLTPRSPHVTADEQMTWTRLVAQWWTEVMRLVLSSQPTNELGPLLMSSRPAGLPDLELPAEQEPAPLLQDLPFDASKESGDAVLRVRQAVAHVVNSTLDEVLPPTELVDLGVDSVTAIAIVHHYQRLSQEATPALTLRHILEGRTPQGIVHLALASALATDVSASAPPPSDEDIPILPSQADHLAEDILTAEINTFAYIFSGTCTSQLAQAWRELVAGHEVLRLRFDPTRTLARIGQAEAQFTIRPLEVGTECGVPVPARAQAVAAAKKWTEVFYTEVSGADGQVETMPSLAQAQFVPVAEDKVVVLLHLHHSLYDAESLAMIVNDLIRLSRQPGAPVGPDHYAAVAWAAARRSEESEVRAYWDNMLAAAPVSRVGDKVVERRTERDGASTAALRQKEVGGGTFLSLDAALVGVSQLERWLTQSRWQGLVTVRGLLISSWARAVADLLDATEVSIGVVRMGRAASVSGVDLGQVAVPVAHALPLVVRLVGHGSAAEQLLEEAQHVQQTLAQQRAYELTHRPHAVREAADTEVNVLWPSARSGGEDEGSDSWTPEQLDVGLRQEFAGCGRASGTTAAAAVRLDMVFDPARDAVDFGALVAPGAEQVAAALLEHAAGLLRTVAAVAAEHAEE